MVVEKPIRRSGVLLAWIGAAFLLAPTAAASHGAAPSAACANMSVPAEFICAAQWGVDWSIWAAVLMAEYDWATYAHHMAACAMSNPVGAWQCR